MASKVSATPESCPVNWPADAPRAQVVMTEGPGQSATWHLTQPMTIVGWGGASTLQPDDRSMSKMQCLLVHTGRHLLLRDLHSPNPTRLNGERTSIAALSDGDRISMGQTTLTVHLESTGVPEPDPGHDALSMPGRLELADTASAEKAVLEKAVTLLGRRESLDIYLEDTAISPAHAVIFPFNNRPMIRDLGSRTGFEVNGGLRTFCLLNDGDRLHVGPFEVNVRLEAWPDEIPSAASAPPTESDRPPKEPLADSPPPAPEPAPQPAAPEQADYGPSPPPLCLEDLTGLDDLRRKVSLLCEELLTYRDRLEAWEGDLSTYAQELASKPEEPAARPASQAPASQESADPPEPSPPSTPEEGALADGPEQALDRFGEVLDRAQSVLDPAAPPPENQGAEQTAAPEQNIEPSPAGSESAAGPADQEEASEKPDQPPEEPPQPAADAEEPADPESAQDASAEDAGDAPNEDDQPEGDGAPVERSAEELVDELRHQPQVNSLDLDPEVADQLRLMRRLNPGIADGELLEQILAEQEGLKAKPASKKSSWWLRR